VWPTISEGKPSPRREVVYNVEPSVAGIREGDWKLVWTTTLPTRVELFNLRTDPFEKTNVAEQHPEKVVELQNRAEQLAREGVPPLVMEAISAAAFGVLTASVTLPEDERPPASKP
jgi:arylsulfatase A-like enzyme